MTWEDKEVVSMKTIEERAWEKYPEVIKHHNLARIDINKEKRKMYIEIATEQKAIDEKEINELFSIMESSASVLGIGTEWFDENERLQAVAELKEKIINYLLFSDQDL